MTEKSKPAAPPPTTGGSDPAPTQPFNWLPILGFLVGTAVIIAVAFYFLK